MSFFNRSGGVEIWKPISKTTPINYYFNILEYCSQVVYRNYKQAYCKISTLKIGGIVQRHHLYWPRRAFRVSATHWKFRQLPCHIVLVTPEEHKEIHAQRRASEMPTREQMLQKLDLCRDCKGGV